MAATVLKAITATPMIFHCLMAWSLEEDADDTFGVEVGDDHGVVAQLVMGV